MSNPFFDHPILNSPYECPLRHWELNPSGQPTQQIIERRRRAEFITPIPKPKKRKKSKQQDEMVFDEGKGLSTKEQQYDPTSIINEVRQNVDSWRDLRGASQWLVASVPPSLIAGRPVPNIVTSIGSFSRAIGRPSSAALPSPTRRSAPESRTTTSVSKCRTATARRSGSIWPISSCWWMTAPAPATSCTSSSRSKATGARTRRGKNPPWKPTGCPA